MDRYSTTNKQKQNKKITTTCNFSSILFHTEVVYKCNLNVINVIFGPSCSLTKIVGVPYKTNTRKKVAEAKTFLPTGHVLSFFSNKAQSEEEVMTHIF